MVNALYLLNILISIHAPREGGDWNDHVANHIWDYFNPRPPRGGRRSWGGS